MDRSRYLTLLILLGMLTALTALSIDPTLSSMPDVAREFGVENGLAQLSLIGFMLGIAAGQLVVGPLADRFGRRPVILVAIVVYVAAATGAATTIVPAKAAKPRLPIILFMSHPPLEKVLRRDPRAPSH